MGKTGFMDIREEDLDLSEFDKLIERVSGTEEERNERLRKAEREHKESETKFRALYGDKWFEEYLKQCDVLDTEEKHMRRVNDAIYNGWHHRVMGCGMSAENSLHERRMHEVYGNRYNELKFHKAGDPQVKELLLRDAFLRGKRNELPDYLLMDYDRMVQNGGVK